MRLACFDWGQDLQIVWDDMRNRLGSMPSGSTTSLEPTEDTQVPRRRMEYDNDMEDTLVENDHLEHVEDDHRSHPSHAGDDSHVSLEDDRIDHLEGDVVHGLRPQNVETFLRPMLVPPLMPRMPPAELVMVKEDPSDDELKITSVHVATPVPRKRADEMTNEEIRARLEEISTHMKHDRRHDEMGLCFVQNFRYECCLM